jgi:hypothetical protein
LPPANNARSGAGDTNKIVAQKWAEILEPWSSQNFARPGGNDKFSYDESRVYCATNVSGSGPGSVWSLLDPVTGLAPTTTPEVDDIWGGPSVDGFYLLSGWDGTNVTLGAKQFDVPSNWASQSNGDDDACFGTTALDCTVAARTRGRDHHHLWHNVHICRRATAFGMK